jgi:hypothetical protein
MKLLRMDWYLESPIDFEHKNYILLDYISNLDSSFSNKVLSPYLLWTEKLVNELINFELNLKKTELNFKKELYTISNSGYEYKQIERFELLDEIYQIVDYSKPLLESKIKLGYQLFNKYPQILY